MGGSTGASASPTAAAEPVTGWLTAARSGMGDKADRPRRRRFRARRMAAAAPGRQTRI